MKAPLNRTIAIAAVLAAVGLAGGSINETSAQPQQQRPAQQQPPRPSAQTVNPPAANPAPTAAPQPAAPSAPVRTERITYDSWTVTCTDAPDNKAVKKTCSAMLQVIEEKQRQVLMVWVIGLDNQGVLRTVIQSPTGVQIAKGVELKFGNNAAKTLPYTACTPQSCESSIVMDDALVREGRAATEATATIIAVDGRAINFKMGVKGIDKALASLGK